MSVLRQIAFGIAFLMGLANTHVMANSGPENALSGRITRAGDLASASHTSDGTERARGGPPRFMGALGARAISFNGYQYVNYYTGRTGPCRAKKPIPRWW